MELPFSYEEFLKVFEIYNLTVWPVQLFFYLLALVPIISIFKRTSQSAWIIFSILSFFWLWMGIVYHIIFFSNINRVSYIFGTAFIAQGIIFLYFGIFMQTTQFKFELDFAGIAGIVMILYSLVLYPILGYVSGHVYPQSPTFGVPCPTTIFTFGILLFSVNRIPWYGILIPFLWSLVGFSAAVNLQIKEDLGLVFSGVAATIILLFYKPKNL